MAKMKKIVLFLVEGIIDKVTWEAILPALVENNNIDFQLTYGDVTTKEYVTTQNVLTKVGDFVKCFLDNKHFEKKNILKIVHLVDTDGAFIDKDAVIYRDTEHILYHSDTIETKDIEYIKRRNQVKAASLKKLAGVRTVAGMNYEIYFFSSNLEHVLYNIQKDLTSEEKMELAEQFSDEYADCPEKLLEFIKSPEFAVEGDYSATWTFIGQRCNSLNRFCNFHLFFDQ